MGRKARILYAEDHEDVTELIELLLKRQIGCETVPAHTYAEALARARGERFDMFILDKSLEQGRDGLALCRELRALAPDTPIVFYTGDALPSARADAMAAGAQAYVVKPYVLVLAEQVSRLLAAGKLAAAGDG